MRDGGLVAAGAGFTLSGVTASDLALLCEALRRVREQMVEHRVGGGLGSAEVFVYGRFDFAGAFGLQGFLARFIPDAQLY
jgi:hypothetical protein